MLPEIALHLPLAQAIAKLLHPYGEVVVHDLKKQRVAAIYNNISKRNVGDDSLMDSEVNLKDLPDFFSPYYKVNWDGRKLKSTSVTIRDSKGEAIGLFCINLDISALDDLHRIIDQFIHLKAPSIVPQDFFFDDWKEKVNNTINQYLQEKGLTLDSLTSKQKRELFNYFEDKGLLQTKRVVEYVQSMLDVAKASCSKTS